MTRGRTRASTSCARSDRSSGVSAGLARTSRSLALGERKALGGVFCQQCGACLAQCPAGADVPRLMRASMYLAADAHPDRALNLLRGRSAADIPCRACRRCRVRCALGLDVRGAACGLAPLLEA